MRVTRPSAPYRAPALEKGLAILELLAGDDRGLGMAEIAKALGRSHNEIYRMLMVLERQAYLTRTPEEKYVLTGRLFDLAMRQAPRRNLHDAALPIMHRLAERLWQSCHLAVISGADIVVVARVESPDLLGFAVRVGYRRPIGLSTSGRVLFGFADVEVQRRLSPTIAAQLGPAKAAAFTRDARRAARDGVHSGPSATVSLITDVGAPVFDAGQSGAVASLTVPFVSGSNDHADLEEAKLEVKAAAARISRVLAFGGG